MPETELLERFKYYLLFSIIFICSDLSAQNYPNANVDSLLKNGIQQIVKQEYSLASDFFNKLNKEYPSLPLGKIYLAAIKITEAYDYGEDFDEVFILDNLESARLQSNDLMKIDQQNIWYRYFYALSEGYLSYYKAINGDWISALTTGVNSISEFEGILNYNKKFYEAYIAIGTFEYWKSSKLEILSWLPFSHDTKSVGIDLLKMAIDSASYNAHLAINSLIWIYIDQKNYTEAIKTAEKALNDFPDSRTFKWGLARAYEESNPLQAVKLYKEILKSYPILKNGNYKNKITLNHLIAQQFAKLGDKKEAIKYCDEILSMKNIPEKVLDELSERMERVKELKKELTFKN